MKVLLSFFQSNKTLHNARIVSLRDGFAEISITENTNCPDCHVKDACKIVTGEIKTLKLKADRVDFREGEFVSLEISEVKIMETSIFKFLIPSFIVVLLLMVLVKINSDSNLILGIVLATVSLYYGLWFFAKKFFQKKVKYNLKKTNYHP